MDLAQRRKSQRVSLKRTSLPENSYVVARKRKSLLLQHSQSLNIPVEDLSQYSGLNCFLNIPDQVFSVTYLSENDTQNPESLKILEDFKYGNWQPYFAGLLFNFSYQPAQRKSLEKAITSGLKTRFQNARTEMTYHTQVSRCKALSPTENDSEALYITVIGRTQAREQVLYRGYLISWCSTVKESHPFLPVLLCQGTATYREQVNGIVSEKFDMLISRLSLTPEELRHLATYCLIMLEETDSYNVTFTYKFEGKGNTLQFTMSVEPLLKLWNAIHQDESNDIDLEEVILYHEALEQFFESTFGIKSASFIFQEIKVNNCFCLHANSKMWFKSTKVIHVVLKYLNHLATKRLHVKTLDNYLDDCNLNTDSSDISH